MAFLDVSDAFDVDMLQCFRVQRQAETVDAHGRSQVAVTWYEAKGVVTISDKNDLDRSPEADIATKGISIVTKFRLQLASTGTKADIVYWSGDYYQVVAVDDYSSFGSGFVQSIARSIDYQDRPPQIPELTP